MTEDILARAALWIGVPLFIIGLALLAHVDRYWKD